MDCSSVEPLLAILKVHRDLARTSAALLDPALALPLAGHCAQLVAVYARHAPPPPPRAAAETSTSAMGLSLAGGNGGRGASAAEDAEEMVRYKQVKTLLQLLHHLATREEDGGGLGGRLGGGGDAAAAEHGFTSALCASLAHLLPCVTQPLLEFPKLCAAYFTLLGSLLENRPLAAVSMPPALYTSVSRPRPCCPYSYPVPPLPPLPLSLTPLSLPLPQPVALLLLHAGLAAS